ncbi:MULTISPECIES: hypothetical protein [Demequina]|uniref:Cell division protein FtsL n=1 Tax=Demequina litorisediminis TaxID=1849022 RepID=A0ABQ6IKC5_9MICO|nr:hypothetical protein [Demequina litorisediminis]GMA37158.1 hypothetical protein GCM10025876_33620 [Demequina litorisediminis]
MSAAPVRQHRPVAVGATARRANASSPAPEPRRHLHAVAAPEQARSIAPFAWTCIAIVLTSLLAVLLINTQMTKGAYERRDLKIEIASLHQQSATLTDQLERNDSPTYLAQRASDLGMEPASTLGSVSIADGAVLEQGE